MREQNRLYWVRFMNLLEHDYKFTRCNPCMWTAGSYWLFEPDLFLLLEGGKANYSWACFFLKLAWEPSFAWRSKPFFPCTSKLKFYANRSRGLRVMIRHTNRTKVHTSYLNILTWLSFPLFNVISKYVTSRLAILNVCKLRSTC